MQPILGDKIEVEVIMTTTPYETDYRTGLYKLFGEVLAEHDAGSTTLPFMIPASSDGRYLAARGVKVYGFSPMKQEPDLPLLELAHGHNERLSVENLAFGTEVLYEVVRRFCC